MENDSLLEGRRDAEYQGLKELVLVSVPCWAEVWFRGHSVSPSCLC